jgi:hypothetical protein
MKKTLFLALLSLSFALNDYGQDWIRFSLPDTKFSIMFPDQPSVQTDSSTTYPAYTTKLFLSKTKTDLYVVGWVDYEKSYVFDAQKELEANRDNFIKAINGTLVESKNVDFKGYKGVEFSARAGSYFWTSKVFIVGRRPYQLLAGSNSGKESENENKFYSSFSIKND